MSVANAKPDQLRPVPRHNINKETESNEDNEPRHCTNPLLSPVRFHRHVNVDRFRVDRIMN